MYMYMFLCVCIYVFVHCAPVSAGAHLLRLGAEHKPRGVTQGDSREPSNDNSNSNKSIITIRTMILTI